MNFDFFEAFIGGLLLALAFVVTLAVTGSPYLAAVTVGILVYLTNR